MANGIKSYMNAIKMAQNPSGALSEICKQNPQAKSIVDMCRGRNPKDVFIEKCQEMGYDPQEIIKLLL